MPSRNSYDYFSTNSLSSDEVDISDADTAYVAHCLSSSSIFLQSVRRSRRAESVSVAPVSASTSNSLAATPPNHLWSASGLGTGLGTQAASECVLLVGVYGEQGSEYSLTLTSSTSATLLQLGVTQTGSVSQDQSKLYKAVPSSSKGAIGAYTLRLSLTPYSGHVSLFVSCRVEKPNVTNHDWQIAPAAMSGSQLGMFLFV